MRGRWSNGIHRRVVGAALRVERATADADAGSRTSRFGGIASFRAEARLHEPRADGARKVKRIMCNTDALSRGLHSRRPPR